MGTEITIRAVGRLRQSDLLPRLGEGLAAAFGVPCRAADGVVAVDGAYNPERNQYSAPSLLQSMRSPDAQPSRIELGVTEADLYADGLTFVFGQAEMPGQWAIISLYRLQHNGGDADDDLFYRRVLTEAVHEIGHTLGLAHCPDPRCVMHFSNDLPDTDRKGPEPCPACQGRLSR